MLSTFVFEDVARMVVAHVGDEVVPVFVVQLCRHGDQSHENVGDPFEVLALRLPLDVALP